MSAVPHDIEYIAHGIAADLPTRVGKINREMAESVIARALMAERERHKPLIDALESIEEHAQPHYGANAARQALAAYRALISKADR